MHAKEPGVGHNAKVNHPRNRQGENTHPAFGWRLVAGFCWVSLAFVPPVLCSRSHRPQVTARGLPFLCFGTGVVGRVCLAVGVPPSPLLLQGLGVLVGRGVWRLPPCPAALLLLPAFPHCAAVRHWTVASSCSYLSVSLGPPPASSQTWLVDHWHDWHRPPLLAAGFGLLSYFPSLFEEFGDLVRAAHDEDPGFVRWFWQVSICNANQLVSGLPQLMPSAQSPLVGLV